MTGATDEGLRRNAVPVTLVIRAWQETGSNGFRARIISGPRRIGGPRRARDSGVETTTDPEQVLKLAREWLTGIQNLR
ncbi:hypothetical protein [Arthrobacter sp. VKM Ac-2550]|uniref:hypothetical protein n=1 Tax=Crystallibacter permensis TaxID=1938888 RepID=UPI0022267A25|nr:hypothetical protein [Arthrobacter sp. VKM Ac-2550]MCW2135388.1 hypothetical protein [Arthrobacter sp. VKM Ac-2550]